MRLDLFNGDCLEVLATLPDNSIDALVTDPPAGISFMNQEWDTDKGGRDAWIDWMAQVMAEVRRVLKPGAHGLVWAIPRTSHWTATALETAGFEIRDKITHHFGSGFPKNLDISKAIDKKLGVFDQRKPYATRPQNGAKFKQTAEIIDNGGFNDPDRTEFELTEAVSEEAKAFEGWGTALKPGTEEWVLIRKPLAGTVAENVLAYGTGGLNLDACRVGDTGGTTSIPHPDGGQEINQVYGDFEKKQSVKANYGRWPANVILTHSHACGLYCAEDCPVEAMNRQAGEEVARYFKVFDWNFFYCPKPTTAEKEIGLDELEGQAGIGCTAGTGGAIAAGKMKPAKVNDGRQTPIDNPYQRGETVRKNIHPTVKSIALMDYLIRLITPAGATVLDPFMGSGTTGMASVQGGWGFVGIEQNPPFYEIAQARIAAMNTGQLRLL